jgi:hypothetical protein
MRVFLYLVFFILSVETGYGSVIKQVTLKHEKALLKTDSSAVDLKHFDKSALNKYSKQPEFQYKEASTDISWWTRFWRWFWEWISQLFNFGSKNATVWGIFWQIIEVILLVLGVAAFVFLILKSQGINILNAFRRKSTVAPLPYSEFFEDINAINFDEEIENAISKHNYRFAVRLLYLKCLKRLSDAGLIEWQIDKTNSTYINELTNDEQRTAFRLLTHKFEYIWYGEFLIDSQVYQNVNTSFQDFNKRVA